MQPKITFCEEEESDIIDDHLVDESEMKQRQCLL
jgi:hypothetical protein